MLGIRSSIIPKVSVSVNNKESKERKQRKKWNCMESKKRKARIHSFFVNSLVASLLFQIKSEQWFYEIQMKNKWEGRRKFIYKATSLNNKKPISGNENWKLVALFPLHWMMFIKIIRFSIQFSWVILKNMPITRNCSSKRD